MRWLRRGLTAFVVFVGFLFGALAINHWHETTQSNRFYAAHPMLRSMRDANTPASGPIDPSAQYTGILLGRVPVGTTRSDAIRILSSEGIACSPVRNLDGTILAVCHAPQRPPNIPNWHIELNLSADDTVTGGRVLALKATAT
jgi:hypothetical protein